MIRMEVLDTSPVYLCGLMQVLPRDCIEIVGVRTEPDDDVSPTTDVYLMDAYALESLGTAATAYVSRVAERCPVLMLTPTPDFPAQRYLDAGASGAVSKQDDARAIVRAIRTVAEATAAPVVEEPAKPDTTLSPREQQVLQFVAYGYTHAQVARRLGISPHTVDTYVKRIRAKLAVGNKAELARAAVLGMHTMQWPVLQH